MHSMINIVNNAHIYVCACMPVCILHEYTPTHIYYTNVDV